MKKLLILIAIVVLCISMVAAFSIGCKTTAAAEATAAETTVSATTEAETTAAEDTVTAAPVTIKLFGNEPDRNAGQGSLEQLCIESYMTENPNVTIEQEQQAMENYTNKLKVYISSDTLPDLFVTWGLSSFFGPVMENGMAAELGSSSDFDNYNFFAGALDGFSLNDKVYGMPRNADIYVLYYNKSIFDENNVKVPTTYEEFLDAIKTFRAKGIQPISINGKDGWSMMILFQNIILKANGDQNAIYNAYANSSFSKDEKIVNGVNAVKEFLDAQPFQDGFTSADYATARNLFAQGGTAMYYMGEWEMAMMTDTQLPETFRNNVHAIPFPSFKDGNAGDGDMIGLFGTGYAVAEKSEVKDEAVKFVKWLMQPEIWARNATETGTVIPAQKFDTYLTGEESSLQKEIVQIYNIVTSTSQGTINDSSTAEFKSEIETLAVSFAAGLVTPEEFLDGLDKAADKAKAE